jgi:acetylornithine deacetylase/succinyl-diaminopimelate desuccinylase-like protein
LFKLCSHGPPGLSVVTGAGLPAEAIAAIEAAISPVEVIATTQALVAIASHRNTPQLEAGVAGFVHDLLRREGIEAFRREVRPGRPNVIGILRGGDGPCLMFNGHTDTVPPGAMDRPFDPRIEAGILHGRGACDMKSGLAAQLHALIALKRSGVALAGDVVITAVIAEEDGTSLGSLDIVEQGPHADMVVVAEPTSLRVAVAHKGFDYYRIVVEGAAAHSSRPERGRNAIYGAAAIVREIETGLVPALSGRAHALLGPATINVASIIGYPRSEEATAFGRGSLQKPDGGTVPDRCTVSLDARRLPGSTTDDMLHELRQIVNRIMAGGHTPTAQVDFTPACAELPSHPPLDTDIEHPLVSEAVRLASTLAGRPAHPIGVPYWSDAALFNALWDVPAIVFGPGDIAVAHSNHECVPVDEIVLATRINALLAAALLRAA